MSNITQIVNVDKKMTTLKKGVVASGLGKTLSESGPYTIFAPSDKAFEKLDKKLVESLLEPANKAKLTELLNHHVVAGKIHQKDLKDGDKLKTLSGGELHVVVKEGVVSIDGASIQGQEVEASNGSVFSLDTVIQKK
ncbi:MAG TPA: fasciclin domain-containing protein [Puia sp.]|nr:fasciclin domain-containing protein [Puia sp.]